MTSGNSAVGASVLVQLIPILEKNYIITFTSRKFTTTQEPRCPSVQVPKFGGL
jgi:hypothetical protein